MSPHVPARHSPRGAAQHGQAIVTPVFCSIRPCTCCVALVLCVLPLLVTPVFCSIGPCTCCVALVLCAVPLLVSVGAATQVLGTHFTTNCMNILISCHLIYLTVITILRWSVYLLPLSLSLSLSLLPPFVFTGKITIQEAITASTFTFPLAKKNINK